MVAAWYSYNLGYRISKANTLHLIDHDELKRELIAKQVECEVPKCHDQAVTILKAGVAAYVCASHESACAITRSRDAAAIIKTIIAAKNAWIEEKKQAYFDAIHGMESLVVEYVPGESIIATATKNASNARALEKENTVPESRAVLLPFIF